MTDLFRMDQIPGAVLALGQIVATARIVDAQATDFVLAAHVARCLARHAAGDWGDVDDDDRAANDHDLANGGRILSAYELPADAAGTYRDDKVWIITEHDRSVTTILWPSDY